MMEPHMIDPMSLLSVAGFIVTAVFGVLLAILGWMGNKLYGKLEEITAALHQIAGDLHEKINDLDKRVTVVETRCVNNHERRSTDK